MIQKFQVSRDDAVYEAWPDLVLTDGGRLICTFTECQHHGDRTNSRIVMTYSDDRGRTWSGKTPVSDYSVLPFFYNNSRISKLNDSSLVIVCDLVDGSHQGEHGTGTTIVLWHGDAEGEHWETPVSYPLCGIVPDKLRQLSDGRFCISAHNLSPETGKLETYFWYSDDDLHTFSARITIASDPRYNLCETNLLETPNGALVAFMRENSGLGLDCMKAISTDNGLTWSPVCPMPIPACHRPVAGYLDNGMILMTYRFMQGGKGWLGSWTQNFFAAFFDTDSALALERREQSVRILPLDYDRSPVSDLGYSGWVQFADGEIYVVTYIVDDAPNAQIRGYSFRYDDVLF